MGMDEDIEFYLMQNVYSFAASCNALGVPGALKLGFR